MAAQFESLSYPFIIMFSILFAFSGVLMAPLLYGHQPERNEFAGGIMLIGIVVKNGIVLIDYITLCRERGMAVLHSVVTAGRSRLRPVLMTTLTTILGMVPMAVGQVKVPRCGVRWCGRTWWFDGIHHLDADFSSRALLFVCRYWYQTQPS